MEELTSINTVAGRLLGGGAPAIPQTEIHRHVGAWCGTTNSNKKYTAIVKVGSKSSLTKRVNVCPACKKRAQSRKLLQSVVVFQAGQRGVKAERITKTDKSDQTEHKCG